MRTITKRSAALGAFGAAVALMVAPAPAQAQVQGSWTNNGCDYSGIGGITPSATTWETNFNNSCSNVWVRVYYRNPNGTLSSRSSYNVVSGGMAAAASGPSGTTYVYSCHAGRSASHGNWSVVRKIGGAGSCPATVP